MSRLVKEAGGSAEPSKKPAAGDQVRDESRGISRDGGRITEPAQALLNVGRGETREERSITDALGTGAIA